MQLPGGHFDLGGRATYQTACGRVLGQPEAVLDPAGQRVTHEVVVGARGGGDEALGGDGGGCLVGRADQGLADDALGPDRRTEERARDPRDLLPLILERALRRHGGRCADALEVLRLAGLADAADQQGDVGALAAAVGVQFVEDEELQAARHADEAVPVVRAGQHQFQHDVVGEEDVRRVPADLAALLVVFLAGVPGEGDGLPAVAVAVVEELLQLFQLAVGERVHRVHDDGPYPLLGVRSLGVALVQHPVDDRHDVGQRLAGAGAGRQDVGGAGRGGVDRVALVLVQPEGTAVADRAVLRLPRLEDAGTLRVQHLLLGELDHGAAALEERVERQPGVRPLGLVIEVLRDVRLDVLIADDGAALREGAVVTDKRLVDVEDIHTGA